jgi:phage repressor protein C with HTH and peptisase S24 domain
VPDTSENPGPHADRHGPRMGFAVVRGRSMEPTLYAGDRLVLRYRATPSPGDLVVVRLPGRPVAVKRAIRHTSEGWWVERDNPAEGVDSWLVGAVADEDVLARVVGRVWPWRWLNRLRRRSAAPR